MLARHGEMYVRSYPTDEAQRRALMAISVCRTAVLGGHLDVCAHCGDERPSYNSCRNRHCAKCQSLSQARWLEGRRDVILPVPHFHVVFTLPQALRPLARANQRKLYALLLRTAAKVLLEFGRDDKWLGAELGVTTVLHTWARDLSYYPHAHCIVTGGGLSGDGQSWRRPAGLKNDFLFPTAALASVFRARFVAALRRYGDALRWPRDLMDPDARAAFLDGLFAQRWVVYCKRSFAGPEHVYQYLGRYTHRVGLSNQRMVAIDNRGVTFRTRGDDTVTLAPMEFIRRFLLHVLPSGFVKIRHYGLFANGRRARLEHARTLVAPQSTAAVSADKPTDGPSVISDWRDLLARLTGIDVRVCSVCKRGPIQRQSLPDRLSRGPPGPPVRPFSPTGTLP